MKILIAEDEQRAREGLARLIGTIPVECEIVGQASDGQQALELIQLADLIGGDHHGDALGVLRNGTGREALLRGNRRPHQLLTARQDQGRRQRRYHDCGKKFLVHGSNLA